MRLCPTFKRIYLLIRVKRGQAGKRQTMLRFIPRALLYYQ